MQKCKKRKFASPVLNVLTDSMKRKKKVGGGGGKKKAKIKKIRRNNKN
jgi:hypothetical protein